MWHMRNPFHNFDFYVAGIVEKPFTRVGRFADRISNPNDGWNWAVCRYKRLRLPFIDYKRGGFEFYFGWRTVGAFGIKFNFTKPKEVPAHTPEKGRIETPNTKLQRPEKLQVPGPKDHG